MQSNAEFVAPPPVEGVGGGGTGYGWNDGSQSATTILPSDGDVARIPTSDLVHVWCMPSTAIIGHQEPPRPIEQVRLVQTLFRRLNCFETTGIVAECLLN